MTARRRNAIAGAEPVVMPVSECLRPLGFTRSDDLFHRRCAFGPDARVEGISLRFEYGFRTCWLQVTVKYPWLIELLSEVRPFAYARGAAWRVPDFNTHLAARLRLDDLPREQAPRLPDGMGWRDDGRLRRARTVPAEALAALLLDLVRNWALPVLESRLTLAKVAAAADLDAYPCSGIAGAWPLAARVVLGDLAGAALAFERHPGALGTDRRRFEAAREWLLRKEVKVAHVEWPGEVAKPPWDLPTHLTGALLP